ncbi:MAG: hypothetical protein WDZ84_09960 [Rhodovibrionaceae bacterium]
MDWTEVLDPYDFINNFKLPYEGDFHGAIAGVAISQDKTNIFVQYSGEHCKNKKILTERLILFWNKGDTEIPEFEILDMKIEPSTKTIDLRGEEWSDNE